MIEGPFATQEGGSGVTQNSRETLINMYVEVEVSGRSKLTRRQRPGLTLAVELAGVKRGVEEFVHGHYIVARDNVYKFDGSALTVIGVLNTKIGPVTMITDDNDDVFISDGEDGYHYDSATGAFTMPTMPTAVGTVAIQGGFGIYAEPNADQFYVSDINDLTTWDALNFATAEGNPDKIVRVFVEKDEIYFFGSKTTEIWRNVGAQDFPFAPNTRMERGCLSAFSVAAEDNSLFWLGDDQIVYRADGYRPARISTHAIEEWIAQAPDKTAGRALVYTTRGHKFYALTFPDYGTRQYDMATGLWSLCRTWGRADWEVVGGAGRATSYHLTPSGIVTLDTSKNTDAGSIMERGGISAPVFNGGRLMTFSAFWLDAETGRAAEGQAEPQAMLQISRNGEEFGAIRARGLGLTGDYARRVIWRNFGQAREFAVKITCTDDVGFAIISTHGELA